MKELINICPNAAVRAISHYILHTLSSILKVHYFLILYLWNLLIILPITKMIHNTYAAYIEKLHCIAFKIRTLHSELKLSIIQMILETYLTLWFITAIPISSLENECRVSFVCIINTSWFLSTGTLVYFNLLY
jgi:hypothetical protein